MRARPSGGCVESRAARHRALSETSRLRIVDALRAADEPLSVGTLAELVGLHVNTTRGHLRVLSDAGIVTAARADVAGPGRPGMVYRLSATFETESESGEHGGYRLLAAMLTGHLGRAPTASDGELRSVGRVWGRYLVERPSPAQRLSALRAAEELARLSEALGFKSTLRTVEAEQADQPGRPDELVFQGCPYDDLARQQPGIVCSLHHGLLQGALEELGGELTVSTLERCESSDTCAARFAQAADGRRASRD